MFLLVPARHLAHTRAQRPLILAAGAERVVFAVTSANEQSSRFNPLPFHVRAIGLDRLAREAGLSHRIFGIPHYRPTKRFAEHILKEIEDQTEGELSLEPGNTVVMSSTPALREQFAALGFALRDAHGPLEPLRLLERLGELGASWPEDPLLSAELDPSSRSVWTDFPDVVRRVVRLFRDPLLTDEGSLTETRDYGVYVFAMSNPAVLEQKYADVRPLIREGRIADEGCADGALLARMARDFPDSDLIGIEITGELLAQCTERLRRGDFGGNYAHFFQRNLFEPVFEPRSIDTTICNSTLHELWSYGQGETTVRAYLERKREQSVPGGHLVIRDVVGPEDGEREVFLWCATEDGAEEGAVAALSTAARFRRFAAEFRAAPFEYREASHAGRPGFRLRLRDAVEFITKKDYVENWPSEMQEAFAFWSFSDWQAALQEAGFTVSGASRVYANPWIVDHRWRGKVELFAGDARLPDPPTTMVLLGRRS